MRNEVLPLFLCTCCSTYLNLLFSFAGRLLLMLQILTDVSTYLVLDNWIPDSDYLQLLSCSIPPPKQMNMTGEKCCADSHLQPQTRVSSWNFLLLQLHSPSPSSSHPQQYFLFSLCSLKAQHLLFHIYSKLRILLPM